MAPADPEAAPHLVLGTAGHIDHGKTALVQALTGVDTDRLPEEKARGITIELGFAPLDVAGARLGVVDVPGHERLVRTMVAGASGIDLVLLVVAADEGVMPQTREHVAICELLGVEHAVVALTKIDAVDAELAELAADDVRGYLEQTRLAGAPLVPVSARTGSGLEALRVALGRAAGGSAARTPRWGPPRLSVDRVFAARGFGAVATGTLVGGCLNTGDAVEIHPSGARARVRGLQCHGEGTEQIAAGSRCAVNLQGVDRSALARGMVLTQPDALAPTRTLDVRLEWLPEAPAAERAAVLLLVGTAERTARVSPIGARKLAPGAAGFARIHVEGDPLALLPGDRFVLQGFARTSSGGATLGGGSVLDVAPPRRRRSDPGLVRDLQRLAEGDPQQGLAVRIGRAGLAGVAREDLARETGTDVGAALDTLARTGRAAATANDRWLGADALAALETQLTNALDAHHAAAPLEPGMPGGALRGKLPANVPGDAAELALARLAERAEIVADGDRVRRPQHRAQLDPEQKALADRILADAEGAGLEPPPLREWAERIGSPAEKLRPVLAHLERTRQLVRAGAELWFASSAVDALRQRVVAHLRAHASLATPDYKALIGTPRRTAVPLMELFDAEHVTLRRGDVRVLRNPSRSAGEPGG